MYLRFGEGRVAGAGGVLPCPAATETGRSDAAAERQAGPLAQPGPMGGPGRLLASMTDHGRGSLARLPLFFALLPRVTLLTSLPIYVLLAAAAWYGSVLEHRQLRTLERRRARGMLSLGITWVTLTQSLLLAGLLLGGAHLAGWSHVRGWATGPSWWPWSPGCTSRRGRGWASGGGCGWGWRCVPLPCRWPGCRPCASGCSSLRRCWWGRPGAERPDRPPSAQQRLRRDGYTPRRPARPTDPGARAPVRAGGAAHAHWQSLTCCPSAMGKLSTECRMPCISGLGGRAWLTGELMGFS